jgi:hypothetical protein
MLQVLGLRPQGSRGSSPGFKHCRKPQGLGPGPRRLAQAPGTLTLFTIDHIYIYIYIYCIAEGPRG